MLLAAMKTSMQTGGYARCGQVLVFEQGHAFVKSQAKGNNPTETIEKLRAVKAGDLIRASFVAADRWSLSSNLSSRECVVLPQGKKLASQKDLDECTFVMHMDVYDEGSKELLIDVNSNKRNGLYFDLDALPVVQATEDPDKVSIAINNTLSAMPVAQWKIKLDLLTYLVTVSFAKDVQ